MKLPGVGIVRPMRLAALLLLALVVPACDRGDTVVVERTVAVAPHASDAETVHVHAPETAAADDDHATPDGSYEAILAAIPARGPDGANAAWEAERAAALLFAASW